MKFRAGWSESELVFRELAKIAEGCGLDAVAMHARTREQGYSGQAQWQWIAELKSLVSIPVIGNGDIRTPEDARAMVAETGCDGVMIGRAAASNPWIFRQISQYTAEGRYDVASRADRYGMIRPLLRNADRRGISRCDGQDETVCFVVHPWSGGRGKAAEGDLRGEERGGDCGAVDVFFARPAMETEESRRSLRESGREERCGC